MCDAIGNKNMVLKLHKNNKIFLPFVCRHKSRNFILPVCFQIKVKDALHFAGIPILCGDVTTILGLCALIFSESNIYQTFFKTIVLVMIFGKTMMALLFF
jgi:hypothetical protein